MFRPVNTVFIANMQLPINTLLMATQIERLLQVMADRGLTDAQLARAIGESDQTFHNWKRRGSIPADKVFRVSRALGVNPEWLWDEAGPREPVTAHWVSRHWDSLPMTFRRALWQCMNEVLDGRLDRRKGQGPLPQEGDRRCYC